MVSHLILYSKYIRKLLIWSSICIVLWISVFLYLQGSIKSSQAKDQIWSGGYTDFGLDTTIWPDTWTTIESLSNSWNDVNPISSDIQLDRTNVLQTGRDIVNSNTWSNDFINKNMTSWSFFTWQNLEQDTSLIMDITWSANNDHKTINHSNEEENIMLSLWNWDQIGWNIIVTAKWSTWSSGILDHTMMLNGTSWWLMSGEDLIINDTGDFMSGQNIIFIPEYPQSEFDESQLIIIASGQIAVNQSGYLIPETVKSVQLNTNITKHATNSYNALIARHNLMMLTPSNIYTWWSIEKKFIHLGNTPHLILKGIEFGQLTFVQTPTDLIDQLKQGLANGASIWELYLYNDINTKQYSDSRYGQSYRVIIFYGSDMQWYVLDYMTNQWNPILLSDYMNIKTYTHYAISVHGYQIRDTFDIQIKQRTWSTRHTRCDIVFCENTDDIGTAYFDIKEAKINKNTLHIRGTTDQTDHQVSICLIDDDNNKQQLIQTHLKKNENNQSITYQAQSNLLWNLLNQSIRAYIILHDWNYQYIGLHGIPMLNQ